MDNCHTPDFGDSICLQGRKFAATISGVTTKRDIFPKEDERCPSSNNPPNTTTFDSKPLAACIVITLIAPLGGTALLSKAPTFCWASMLISSASNTKSPPTEDFTSSTSAMNASES